MCFSSPCSVFVCFFPNCAYFICICCFSTLLKSNERVWLTRSVFLNLLPFRSPLPSIAAFPFTLLWMYGRYENNHSHRIVIVRTLYFGTTNLCFLLSSIRICILHAVPIVFQRSGLKNLFLFKHFETQKI